MFQLAQKWLADRSHQRVVTYALELPNGAQGNGHLFLHSGILKRKDKATAGRFHQINGIVISGIGAYDEAITGGAPACLWDRFGLRKRGGDGEKVGQCL